MDFKILQRMSNDHLILLKYFLTEVTRGDNEQFKVFAVIHPQ